MLILVLTVGSLGAHAVTVEVIGKNGTPLLNHSRISTLPSHVGQISVEVFDEKSVTYQGGIFGISAMFGLGQDIEVISDSEMKAHGWCFALDGAVPETMPDQTPVARQDSTIVWYYAYAHYKDGAWIGQCVRN